MRQLQEGNKGPAVGRWQMALVACGHGGELGTVDKDFGPKTKAATEALQAELGLAVTGKACRATQLLAVYRVAELCTCLLEHEDEL